MFANKFIINFLNDKDKSYGISLEKETKNERTIPCVDAKFKRIARFNNPKVKPEKMHVIPKTANYSYSNPMKVGI